MQLETLARSGKRLQLHEPRLGAQSRQFRRILGTVLGRVPVPVAKRTPRHDKVVGRCLRRNRRGTGNGTERGGYRAREKDEELEVAVHAILLLKGEVQ